MKSQNKITDFKSSIKPHYRSGLNDLGLEFFKPCLESCIEYKRASGYFTSNVLKTWALALPIVIERHETVIKLIISPQLSESDLNVLKTSSDPYILKKHKKLAGDRIVSDLIEYLENPSTPKAERIKMMVFCWLIANGRLTIKFAFSKHVSGRGIFHEKIGIFDFGDGQKVAFTGSANETESGHLINYESIDVYRSWNPNDIDRVTIKEQQFEEAWRGEAPGLDVYDLSEDTLKKVKVVAEQYVKQRNNKCTEEAIVDKKWIHQTEALDAFMDIKAGILEMATGTGKTKTAIKILDNLFKKSLINSAIITTDGNDLLDQWSLEINEWASRIDKSIRVYRQYRSDHELYNYVLNPSNAIIIISRTALHNVIGIMKAENLSQTFIVHDEVHGLGSPSNIQNLTGKHQHFVYRLGLSATPEREYDEAGTAFIAKEIGEVFYRFELKDAIRRGILCEFQYIPLSYELTDSDRARLQAVYMKKAGRAREGKPMSDKEVWTDIAKVYKTAEEKPLVFSAFIDMNPSYLKSCIIFVETKEYGNQLLNTIHKHTHLYKTYYDDAEQYHLVDFSTGELDCLITCHRLSQGIDIKRLKSVVLFASARSKLETIQRIGRCLRIDPSDPNKRANVIDFVRDNDAGSEVDNADVERFKWLSDLSNTRRDPECL